MAKYIVVRKISFKYILINDIMKLKNIFYYIYTETFNRKSLKPSVFIFWPARKDSAQAEAVAIRAQRNG